MRPGRRATGRTTRTFERTRRLVAPTRRIAGRTSRIAVWSVVLVSLQACDRVPDADFAVVGATVFDGSGAPPIADAVVLVRDGRILAVGPSTAVEVPDGAAVVDAGGMFVIPGLVDAHVHFSSGGLGETDVDRLLRQFLFYGVTTVLNLGATHGTVATIDSLRRRAMPGRAPRIYATGGLITVPGSHPTTTIMEAPPSGDWMERGVRVAATAEEVRTAVRVGANAGMDLVKIIIESGPPPYGDDHPQMPLDLAAAAVEQGALVGLPVVAHASSPDELAVALAAGVDAVVHLVRGADSALLARMAASVMAYVPTFGVTVRAGTWGDPAESLTDPFLVAGAEPRVLASLRDAGLVPTAAPSADDLAFRRASLDELGRAYRAGVPIMAGSDTGNPFVFAGYSMHYELELMVEAGMSPADALVAATRRAAEMLGRSEEFGTLEPGRRADMLVLRADPIEDIRNTRTLEMVIQEGTVLNRETLLGPR